MLTKVTIYGERCSGTNYLEQLLITNFDIEIVRKHFFGFRDFRDLSTSEDVLFIGIVRNIYDWINSFYREKHHLPNSITENEDTFLQNEFYSIEENGDERKNDRNIYTKERYKNIFELRHIKNKYLIEDLPTLVKNYLLITYEDLMNNFIDTMYKISGFHLPIRDYNDFPLNVHYYKHLKHVVYRPKKDVNQISKKNIRKYKFTI